MEHKPLLLGALLLGLCLQLCAQRVKPPQVQPGDVVGFISPASPPYYIYNSSDYQSHVESSMAKLGLMVRWAPHSFSEYGYLAGTDEERAEDVMAMFWIQQSR